MIVNKHIKNIAVGSIVIFSFNQLLDENNFPIQPIIDLPVQEIPFERNLGTRFGISSVSAGVNDSTFQVLRTFDSSVSSNQSL